MSDLYLATTDDAWAQRVRDAFGGTFTGHIGTWAFSSESIDIERALADIRP
mgnify:CR=1 FL=1